ncbi:hypothetical protein ACHQM5_022478 [Ranunculus cassubicifolius]
MSTSTYYPRTRRIAVAYPNPVTPTAPPAPTYHNPDIPDPAAPPLVWKAVVAILIAGLCYLALIILFFKLRPHGPKNPGFLVDSVSIPSFNASSQVIVNWNIAFVVNNPNNHKGWRDCVFDPTSVSVLSQKNFVAGTMISPFRLGNGTETKKIVANFATPAIVLNDVYSRNFGGQNSGEVSFDFKLDSRLHARGKMFSRLDASRLHISCKDVLVGFLPNTRVGTLSGVPKNCRVVDW